MTLKDLGYKPREAAVRIVMDDTLREEIEAASAAFALYRRTSEGDLEAGRQAKERLEAAEAAAESSAVTFRFRAISRAQVADLVRECPPTETQLDRWREQAKAQPLVAKGAPEFDWDSFAPRLIAASMIEPETSEEEVLDMWNDTSADAWSDAIWESLWTTAWSVNQQISTRPTYGTGSEKT